MRRYLHEKNLMFVHKYTYIFGHLTSHFSFFVLTLYQNKYDAIFNVLSF
jgi:hypothetical protein